MIKDYYKILGLSPYCSQEDIKKAYRKLARDLHPDSCGKEDSSQFREVQEAYEAIGEKSKRSNYDRERRIQQQRLQNIPTYSFCTRETDFVYPFSFENYFEQILNRFLNHDPFFPKRDSFGDHLELILNPEEARAGGIIPVEVPIHQLCPVCRGKGSYVFFFCDHCDGAGSIKQMIKIKIEVPPNVPNFAQFSFSIPGYGTLNIVVLIR